MSYTDLQTAYSAPVHLPLWCHLTVCVNHKLKVKNILCRALINTRDSQTTGRRLWARRKPTTKVHMCVKPTFCQDAGAGPGPGFSWQLGTWAPTAVSLHIYKFYQKQSIIKEQFNKMCTLPIKMSVHRNRSLITMSKPQPIHWPVFMKAGQWQGRKKKYEVSLKNRAFPLADSAGLNRQHHFFPETLTVLLTYYYIINLLLKK